MSLSFSGVVFSYEILLDQIYSPEGFVWQVSGVSEAGKTQLRLVERRSKTPTNIIYSFDPKTGKILDEGFRQDSEHQLALKCFGCALWQPHPGQRWSLEEKFISIFNLDGPSWFQVKQQRGLNNWVSFEEWVSGLDPVLEASEVLIERLRKEVEETRRSAMGSLPSFLKKELDTIDVVEANQSHESGDLRMDAFSVFPLEKYLEESTEFLDALVWLSRRPSVYLLSWLMAYEALSFNGRLAVLMLFTHNHETEYNFVRLVAGQQGMLEAWKAFKAINQIYWNERNYWRQEGRFQKNEALKKYYSDPIDLFGEPTAWLEVDSSLKANVLEPLFGFESQQDRAFYLPYAQMYHYYGSLIVSFRMNRELGFSDNLVKSGARALGIFYKLKTQGLHWAPLELMDEYYSQGAKDALRLQAFIRD